MTTTHPSHKEETELEDSCCTSDPQVTGQETDTQDDCCKSDLKKNTTKPEKKLLQLVAIVLSAVVILNIFVITWFTYSVNAKLDTAIEKTSPQKGSLTLIVPTECSECGELESERNSFSKLRVSIEDEIKFDSSSSQAQELMKAYNITKLPALIFESEKEIREDIVQASTETGARVSEMNKLVWEKEAAPYFDVQNNTIEGLVSVTYITDSSCETCYDVISVQRSALQRFGVAIASEDIVDISSTRGKELLETYSINAVPTIIVSSKAESYSSLMQVWPQVGTREQDGVYVFRKLDALNGTYKDLKTGIIISPKIEE